MSESLDRLRARREALLRRGEAERRDFQGHLQHIETALGGVDRGLGLVTQFASPPVLISAGVLGTILLGRGRAVRTLVGALAVLGPFLLRHLDLGQLVRRSR